MIDKEQFELQKQAVEWISSFGITPLQAMVVVSNAQSKQVTLCESFVELFCEIEQELEQAK